MGGARAAGTQSGQADGPPRSADPDLGPRLPPGERLSADLPGPAAAQTRAGTQSPALPDHRTRNGLPLPAVLIDRMSRTAAGRDRTAGAPPRARQGSTSGHQPVADPGLSDQVPRVCGIGFEFAPQLREVDPQIVRLAVQIGAAKFLQQLT